MTNKNVLLENMEIKAEQIGIVSLAQHQRGCTKIPRVQRAVKKLKLASTSRNLKAKVSEACSGLTFESRRLLTGIIIV